MEGSLSLSVYCGHHALDCEVGAKLASYGCPGMPMLLHEILHPGCAEACRCWLGSVQCILLPKQIVGLMHFNQSTRCEVS